VYFKSEIIIEHTEVRNSCARYYDGSIEGSSQSRSPISPSRGTRTYHNQYFPNSRLVSVANLQFSVLSDKCLRDINKDACCAERKGNYYVLAVADGLGGHAAGEVASAIAISALKDAMRDCDSPKIALENGVLTADEQIHVQSEQYKERRGMATTLIAACG